MLAMTSMPLLYAESEKEQSKYDFFTQHTSDNFGDTMGLSGCM